MGKSTSGKHVENHSNCPGRGFNNDHSPEERGHYVLERVFRYFYYGSVNALLSMDFRRFSQSKKKIAI